MTTSDATSRDAYDAFARWLDGDAVERAALLQRLRAEQPETLCRLQELIRADAEAARVKFMTGDAIADAAVSEATPDSADDRRGQRVGNWELERPLGVGGMGQVWLARRRDGLHGGRAAIKMLRLITADARANERFAQEGRILAQLVHPNIAMLLDAGVMSDGQRYLVLEFVDGTRIDTWCDERHLDVPARLALFLQVCAAVAHAHANLIVHRDLKPSNILVMNDGTAKLLDFGIAKLIESDVESTALTGDAGSAMTPGYAAPEQISGAAISTATDIYALGVILYRLLSGVGPYGRDSLTPMQLARAAMENEAPRVSDSFALPGAAQRASARNTNLDRLRRMLRGDLDTIVLRALKKEPAERYANVTAMADDIRRHLDNRPIAARADSRTYRARKFVRRHWFGVGAGVAIVLAVVGGVAGVVVKQREAEHEAQRAIAVKRFLLDMFEQARTTVQSRGLQAREATVNDMLAAGADRVETAFAAQPEIRDEIFDVLSSLYTDAFDPSQGIALARRRVDAARAAFGKDDARSAAAEIGLANALLTAGEEPEAKNLLAHAQTILDAEGDRDSLTRAQLLRWQGIVVLVDGATPPWNEHPLRQSINLLRSRYPEDDELLEALVTLPSEACRYHHVDEAIAAAEELYRRAVARYGADNLFVDSATLIRGQLLAAGHRPAEALPYLEKALDGFRRHVGEKNQNVLLTQLDLAETYWLLDRQDDSRRVLAAAEALAASDHAGEPQVEAMLTKTRANIAKLQAGQALSPCGS